LVDFDAARFATGLVLLADKLDVTYEEFRLLGLSGTPV
jgi:hypothetical protein